MIERIKHYVKTHSGEIVVFAITAVFFAGLAVMATGDLSSGFARGGRH